MGERFRDSAVWPALWPMLVRCPRCGACGRADRAQGGDVTRISCPACALVREGRGYGLGDGNLHLQPPDDGRTWRDPDTREIWNWPDPDGQVVPLWLQAPCCGEVLWAVNEEHLAYLEDYIGATLRERPEATKLFEGRPWVGKGLSSKLPDWMKAAKHRDEVVATLTKLRATLP